MKKIIFDSHKCLKCGLCSKIDSDDFKFDGRTTLIDGKESEEGVFEKPVEENKKESILRELVDNCPGKAIEIGE